MLLVLLPPPGRFYKPATLQLIKATRILKQKTYVLAVINRRGRFARPARWWRFSLVVSRVLFLAPKPGRIFDRGTLQLIKATRFLKQKTFVLAVISCRGRFVKPARWWHFSVVFSRVLVLAPKLGRILRCQISQVITSFFAGEVRA